MDTKSVMLGCNVVIVLSFIINLTDYNLTRMRGFMMFPNTVRARKFFLGWSLLLAVLGLCNMLKLLPTMISMLVLAAYVLAMQAYAIFCRHWGPRRT